MMLLTRLFAVSAAVCLLSAGYQYLTQVRPSLAHSVSEQGASSSSEGEHYSPHENLDRVELEALRTAAIRARRAGLPLNVAMYSFTDRAIAQMLVAEAVQGTTIRIYRDGEQYDQERRNGNRFGGFSVATVLRGSSRIQIRLKAASRGDLMHLKSWSDGTVLRDGSANWSPAGLKRQDNNLHFTMDTSRVAAFNRVFEVMWNRRSNTVVQ